MTTEGKLFVLVLVAIGVGLMAAHGFDFGTSDHCIGEHCGPRTVGESWLGLPLIAWALALVFGSWMMDRGGR